MESNNYESNLKNWVSSLMELEANMADGTPPIHCEKNTNSALIPISAPTYYRSKAFTNSIGINNLINAADPLLTLVTKLHQIAVPPEANTLHQNLCHEIRAFENKTQTLGYRSSLVLAARYIICEFLDERIAITWPDIDWKSHSLIEVFHKEIVDQDRFFLILERSLQDAAAHIDLLELVYICLRLGYEGKYRGIDKGHIELRTIVERIFQTIGYYREEFSRNLLVTLHNYHLPKLSKKNYFHLLPSPKLISIFMGLALFIIWIVCYLNLLEGTTSISAAMNELKS